MYFNITSQSNKFLIKIISLENFCKHKNIFPKNKIILKLSKGHEKFKIDAQLLPPSKKDATINTLTA